LILKTNQRKVMDMEKLVTRLLTRSDVAGLLTLPDCISAVEHGFELEGKGEVPLPSILSVHAPNGGLHVKAGFLGLDRPCIVAKVNANFPQNPGLHGLPTIQGVVIVVDAENGFPLIVMDSIEITIQRTGAATAVAAKYLARKDSQTVAIIGCGLQGRVQLQSLMHVLPIKNVRAFDMDPAVVQKFVSFVSKELKLNAVIAASVRDAVKGCDVCVTCTSSKQILLQKEDVPPGMFIAAIGADNEHKQELDPRLFAGNKVVVDNLNQCATIGDLHHAIEQKLVTRESVHADLGSVVAGKKPGRTSMHEIIVFDSTGIALQDAVTAALIMRKVQEQNIGVPFDFFA